MTDYLELLLETQGQEEVGRTPEWRWSGNLNLNHMTQTQARLADKALSGADESEAERVRTQWDKSGLFRQTVLEKQSKAAYTQERVERKQNPNVTIGGQNRPETQPLLTEITRLRRAVRQADAQISRQTSSAAGAAFGNNDTARGAGLPPSKAINYAALVDTAFARDARRYDGPLGLL